MLRLVLWQGVGLGLLLVAAAVLLSIWWRQQSFRWWIVVGGGFVAALALSGWSGIAFRVADYRAGCDGLCPGSRGAPVPFYRSEPVGEEFSAAGFLLNFLIYFVLLVAWAALIRAVIRQMDDGSRRAWIRQGVLGAALFLVPLALSPLFLPPPQAHVRGDNQRIAINAQREVYLYDQLAELPILRVGLVDVRPRADDQPGMRVCLQTYTFFYVPTGFMFLDMTPEGVHSNHGGVLPRSQSCWE